MQSATGKQLDIKPSFNISKATSERASLIEYFVQPINDERLEAKLKPLPTRVIAIRLSHVKTEDLYPFFKSCLDYSKKPKGSFGKAFFGALRVKK